MRKAVPGESCLHWRLGGFWCLKCLNKIGQTSHVAHYAARTVREANGMNISPTVLQMASQIPLPMAGFIHKAAYQALA